jgi:hypothetical protein
LQRIRLAPFLASRDQSLKGVSEPGSPPAAGRPVPAILVTGPSSGKHPPCDRATQAGTVRTYDAYLASRIRSRGDKDSCGNRLQVRVFVRSA